MNSRRMGVLSLVLALLPGARSSAQWVQQGNKLVGTGAVGGAYQGQSVALSADGNTAIVGGYGDKLGAGAAWVYTRSGGVWTQQGNKLVGTGAVGSASQGYSVAISADGNTAVVGGYVDNSYAGAVWVYTRSGGVWTQQGNKLVGTGAVGVSEQGRSVALSADGNTAIVGGYWDDSRAGAVWIYTRSGGVWTQQGNKLVGTGAVGSAEQGYSVAISGEGNTVVVGGDIDNGDAGAIWVFTRSGGIWAQQGNKLVGTGAVGYACQGRSVGLSADGKTAIVGGQNDNGAAGAMWVFAEGSTGVTNTHDVLPRTPFLGQNYPNPFNPSTRIHYTLPRRSTVTMTVYNTLGQKVAELVNAEKDAGAHDVTFNANGLASGVYMYRIQAGSFVQTKKLILVR